MRRLGSTPWTVLTIVLLGLGLRMTTHADTQTLPIVYGTTVTAPTLPSPYQIPGVVCLGQGNDVLYLPDRVLLGCNTSAQSPRKDLQGAVVAEVTAAGTRIVWSAQEPSGSPRFVVTAAGVEVWYIVNASGAFKHVVLEGVR